MDQPSSDPVSRPHVFERRPARDRSITVNPDNLAEASPPRVDVTATDQGPRTSAYDLSTTQPAEDSPQEKAGANAYPVTVDPNHPGGEFPWGG